MARVTKPSPLNAGPRLYPDHPSEAIFARQAAPRKAEGRKSWNHYEASKPAEDGCPFCRTLMPRGAYVHDCPGCKADAIEAEDFHRRNPSVRGGVR